MKKSNQKADRCGRRSIRLKEYDYRTPGYYYITICIHEKIKLLGNIINDRIIPSKAGIMIERWLCKLEEKYAYIKCHEYVVMPNHLHAIIEIKEFVGADPCICPTAGESVYSPLRKMDEHLGISLSEIVKWFKIMTTNEYIQYVKIGGWPSFKGKLWQRNYYEHIIRGEKDYYRICEYINNNPLNWDDDEYFV